MTIHINLLSAQTIPNTIPILAMKPSVQKIYLVVAGNDFVGKAQHLKQFYKRNDIDDVEIFSCPDANDYYSLRYKAKELFDNIQAFYPGQQVILNATCGTKPMSFAFVRQFDDPSENSLAIYVAANSNQIIFLSDSDKLKNVDTSSVMTIDDYLYLNMFQLQKKTGTSCDDDVQARASITKSILQLATEYPKLISLINHLAQKSCFNRPSYFQPMVPLANTPRGTVAELFAILEYQGLIQYTDTSITFDSPEVARYIGGGWFEELIYLAAIEAQVEEVALNVTGKLISDDGEISSVQNELDVVLLHNNHMMIVEAKTANWENSVSSGQEAMSKLDSLSQQYGGSDTKALIAIFYPLPEQVAQRIESIRHLSALHVQTYEQLVETFKNWKHQSDRTTF
ncbi:DUF1887 family CARF protein [Thalassotalea ponticola]|uniref:Card1-like endonuclease domain-containing protein n=1 Tax=Thalassotalea ponticola TaxID=1523392 RepID=UPI0025B42C42|nr:DUF1887 family CARF protein [Thalassotalea ponticola]MDN3651365.1 DUF1887 family CARF protein [Thalassotalea ponticola]